MKAIILPKHGTANVLAFGDHPTPQPQKNEVLVRLKAISINHVDIWVRSGLPAYPVKTPHIMGADGAGVIEAMGPETEGVSVGDRVLILPGLTCQTCEWCLKHRDNQCDSFEILGTKRHGTYAEFVVVPDQNVLPIPDSLSFEDAAAFPLAYLTAWHMLGSRANLQSGETVLVIGASAGIGVAAIQIAQLKGAKVLAVTTKEEKVEPLQKLGAQVHLEKDTLDFSKWVHKETNGRGVDVVFEHVGPATWEKSVKSLARYGRLVTCGATSGPSLSLDLRYIFSRDLSILGARMGTQKEFQDLAQYVFDGKIKPVIDKVFPLTEAAQAHIYIENRQQIGKVLLRP